MKSNTPEKRTIESRTIERGKQEERTNTRSWWVKTILLLTLVVLSVVMLFTLGDYLTGEDTPQLGFGQLLKTINYPLFALLLAVVVLYIAVESAKYAYMLKMYTGKFRFRIAVKTMFLGKYYDGITPLGTGGQPFQIYYLHKKDIPAGVATSVPLVKYIVNTVVFCLIAVGFLITAHLCVDINSIGGTVIMVVAWISLACNFAIPLIIVFASLFPRAGKKLVVKTVGFLNKIRIVKRRYPTMKKYVYEMDEYRHSLKSLIREAWKLIPLILICVIETATYVFIPFCTVLAIAPIPVAAYPNVLLQVVCLSMIAFYSSSLVPTPGNSGANEALTTLAFLTIVSIPGVEPVIGWVVLVWRFFIYYIYILSGIGINIFEIIRGAVRKRRADRAAK